jgi:uncharacterized protein (TIGR00299 family) protein
MKIAYFDCFSGISGDMILGALIDLGLDLNLSGYEIETKKVQKNKIAGIKVNINAEAKQKERHLSDINKLIDDSKLDPEIKQKSKAIFLKLGQAESKVHNENIENIHFHEIGAVDSILDIVGCIIGLKKLNIREIFCSNIPLGKGFIKTSHGKLPVPAPATSELLSGFPVYSSGVEGELVTPTGAAIITTLVKKFGEMPLMKVDKVGYGAGKSDFEHPNVLRVFLGELIEDYDTDVVSIIETNIDDMYPELYEIVFQKLFQNGALDVFLTNIQMKKHRPAVKLSVISTLENTNNLIDIIFNETTTFGLRTYKTERKKLFVEKEKIKIKYGEVTIKIGKSANEIKVISPEYEDCKKLAEQNNVSLKKIYDLARASYFSKQK